PPSIKTFFLDAHKTWSTIDLIFAPEEISEQVTKCATNHGHGSDHEAIDFVINTSLTHHKPEPWFQFRETDWDEFNATLNAYLDVNPHLTSFSSRDDLDKVVEHLTAALSHAIEKTVPKSKHSTYTKRWWSHDLTAL
ncbi:hypothetical protein K439DRAFT_1312780, partial [Ramaria rubella]